MSELYIGKHLDPNGMPGELYHHKLSDLITHTFICGGSGSGKTVMGKALIEEAALKGVPSIIVISRAIYLPWRLLSGNWRRRLLHHRLRWTKINTWPCRIG